jgi:hypothetical protein
MLSIFAELGRTEEFFSEVVYPIWPLWLAGATVLAAFLTFFSYRRGWLRSAASHPLLTSASIALVIGLAAYPAYYTLSPLWERSTVCEASPITGAGAGSEKCDDVVLAATMPPTLAPTAEPSLAPTGAATSFGTAVPTQTPFAAHTVRTGTWMSADDFHYTIGDALLIETFPGEYTLRVENFSVRNGPDVFVLLSRTNDYSADALNLGSLKGTDGAFNYEIPAGTDVSQYRSAIIWCRQFDVLFGHAELT